MTTTDNKNTLEAPVYRYYTVDLLSNVILAEIPFGGVSYERAIKGAGSFSGKIPVLATEANRSWDLYKSTMPGKTGLYIMRDNICVWGGIIWSRSYDVVGRELTVSASEFTSYFHHRRIWKGWDHSYSATVEATDGIATVSFDTGSDEDLAGGASVYMTFPNMTDYKYNGYYVIASDPPPADTNDAFTIEGSVSSVDIVSVSRDNDTVMVYTSGYHGFNTGDQITIVMDTEHTFDGTFTITAPSGSDSSYFQFPNDYGGSFIELKSATGNATRPLPDGLWEEVTVLTKSDTYSYIRSLVEAVFNDFQGIGFADSYLDPGETYALDITNVQADHGFATITTSDPHGLIVGQTVTVQSMGDIFNGDHEIVAIPNDTMFLYACGGTIPSTPVTTESFTVIARSASHNVAQLTTSTAHDFREGDIVSVFPGSDADGQASAYSGDFTITEIPKSNTVRFKVLTSNTIEPYTMTQPTATRGAVTRNIVRRGITTDGQCRITTDVQHGFTTGQTVLVSNVDYTVPITQKTFDYASNIAIVETGIDHNLEAGDSVVIGGIRDSAPVTYKSSTGSTATFTTKYAHPFKINREVTVSNLIDSYRLTHRTVTNSVATVTTSAPHNLTTDDVTISNVFDTYSLIRRFISNGIATIEISGGHEIVPNNIVTISGVKDNYRIGSKSANKGTVTLIMEREHNFTIGDTITITGAGAPYDGVHKVTKTTDTRIYYKIKSHTHHAQTSSAGNVIGANKFINGRHTVSDVTNTTISFVTNAHDVGSTNIAGSLKVASPLNGTFAITSYTDSTFKFTIPIVGVNLASKDIPQATKKGDPQPTAKQDSFLNGTYTISKVSPTTVTVHKTVRNPISKVATSAGTVSSPSFFNGTHTIQTATTTTFQFVITDKSYKVNIAETPTGTNAYARATNIFNGSHAITSVSDDGRSFTFNASHNDIPSAPVYGYGTVTRRPVVISHTYGGFPTNSDIGIGFSTDEYSGATIQPVPYRGFELTNVGEALDQYSDSIDGFEYRIDCDYDSVTDTFSRTFVLLPINFPDPPAPGEISPISRFGADKLVFEYPGNISNVSLAESAENAATRFFAVGDVDLGGDAAKPYSVASATDFLAGLDESGTSRWPLLDDDQKIDKISDKDVLYAYAQRYLSEGKPPAVSITVSVNGSLPPVVGSYDPGDWCSLIVDDEFVRQRLVSKLEPRQSVLVRKIDSVKVSVPDGTTAPEQVTLGLVAEWGVDKVGQ